MRELKMRHVLSVLAAGGLVVFNLVYVPLLWSVLSGYHAREDQTLAHVALSVGMAGLFLAVAALGVAINYSATGKGGRGTAALLAASVAAILLSWVI